jgi:hypothetical protein
LFPLLVVQDAVSEPGIGIVSDYTREIENKIEAKDVA